MDVAAFIRWSLTLFLAALAITVAVLMLTRKIHTRGLLRDKRSGGISPMRIQLLLVTLSGAATYFAKVIAHLPDHGNSLPLPEQDLLVALGGSQALYLAGKAASVFDLASRWSTGK